MNSHQLDATTVEARGHSGIGTRRRLAVAARDPVGTGGGTVALETARWFAAAGHDVRLIVDVVPTESLPGVQVERTPFGMLLYRWKPSGRIAFRVRHFLQILAFSFFARLRLAALAKEGFISIDHNIEAWGGDIVVLHNVFLAQYRADHRPFRRRWLQFLNPVFGLRLWRERMSLRSKRVRGVIAVSPATREEAGTMIGAGKAVEVICSGVDLKRFTPLDADERVRLRSEHGAESAFVVLFVGHEFERKRLDLAIGALAALPERAVLWVVGGRMSSIPRYEALAKELGVGSRVRFFGTRADMPGFFQTADVFLLPSDYETWGLVTLEAMACGAPAIMTNVGCAPDVIRNGENGFIVPPDACVIADCVRRLLEEPELLEQRRDAARETAAKYGWQATAQRYLAFVETSTAGAPYARPV